MEEFKERDGLILNTVGSNDKYLLNKLSSYGITIEKIDNYLKKLNMDNPIDQNRIAFNNIVSYLY